MCNPAVVMLVGSAVSAYGSNRQGAAQSRMMRYQSGIAGQNALFASEEANIIAEQGQVERQNVDLRADVTRGQGLSGIAQAGFEVGRDSALTWDLELAASAERDKQAIQQQTDLAVRQRRQESQNFLAEASMLRRGASGTRRASNISSVGQLVGGASVASSRT